MHDQPPIFGFQNTNESKETPDEQLGLPTSGGLRTFHSLHLGKKARDAFGVGDGGV